MKNTLRLVAVFMALSLVACKATLAPAYDAAIVESLSSSTLTVTTLFTEVKEQGGDKAHYQAHKDTYNEAIAEMEALQMQLKARPAPSNAFIEKVNKKLEEKNVKPIDISSAPSADAIAQIIQTLTKMRDVHKSQGLTNLEIDAFKGQTLIYMEQAIFYERFLKR